MVKAYRDVAYAIHQRKIRCAIKSMLLNQQNMLANDLKQSLLGQCSKRLNRSNSVMSQVVSKKDFGLEDLVIA